MALLCCNTARSQTIFGYIEDASTGERLVGALIATTDGAHATTSNSYGYYSLSANADSVSVRYVGYAPMTVATGQGGRTDIRLSTVESNIDEVTVRADNAFRREIAMPRMSRHEVTAEEVHNTAAMFGEPDVLKTMQFMPGINAAADGTTNLSVRGGSYDQNLIILDEATVYNPSHALGFMSAINPDATESMTLYKGDIPARYGGKLSAVLDTRMREGNNQHFALQGGVGTVASRLLLEGPIKRDTASFMIAGRVGYGILQSVVADWWDMRQYHADEINFFDLSAKVNHTIDSRNRIFASAYASRDAFYASMLQQVHQQRWHNETATLRWNHIFTPCLFANTTLTYSNYRFRQHQNSDARSFNWLSGMKELAAKIDFDRYRSQMHTTFGAAIEQHLYNPGEIEPIGQSAMKATSLDHKSMAVAAAYIANEHNITPRLSLAYGLRLSASFQLGPETIRHYTTMPYYTDSTTYGRCAIVKAYAGLEPRIAAAYQLGDNLSLKASYTHTRQYQHVLSNSALGLPTDVWAPADYYIKPQSADNFALGLQGLAKGSNLDFAVEAYYKALHHVVDFKDNATFYLNEHIETEIATGRGLAYGLEATVHYASHCIDARLSYTISEAKRKIDNVNNGQWYYAMHDQLHNLSVNTTVHIARAWLASATWRYHTGSRTTIPIGTYKYSGAAIMVYSARNAYRLPDFHRLDLALTYKLPTRPGHRFRSELVLSCYNVYGRQNAMTIYVRPNRRNTARQQAYLIYLYRQVPSLTWNFTF